MIVLPSVIVALLSLDPEYDLIAARVQSRQSRTSQTRLASRGGRAAARQTPERAAVPLPKPRPMSFDDRFTAAFGDRK